VITFAPGDTVDWEDPTDWPEGTALPKQYYGEGPFTISQITKPVATSAPTDQQLYLQRVSDQTEVNQTGFSSIWFKPA
jgi:hypothetical protein